MSLVLIVEWTILFGLGFCSIGFFIVGFDHLLEEKKNWDRIQFCSLMSVCLAILMVLLGTLVFV